MVAGASGLVTGVRVTLSCLWTAVLPVSTALAIVSSTSAFTTCASAACCAVSCALPAGQCISLIRSLHPFQSIDQVHCSRHSMAVLQPALSWDFLLHVYDGSTVCSAFDQAP